jgi:hypothetical protein
MNNKSIENLAVRLGFEYLKNRGYLRETRLATTDERIKARGSEQVLRKHGKKAIYPFVDETVLRFMQTSLSLQYSMPLLTPC